MTAREGQPPAPDARFWPGTIRDGILGPEGGWTSDEEHRQGQKDALAALDSLLALVARLTEERDEAHEGDGSLFAAQRRCEIRLVFALTTEPQDGHPHSEYTHRCDVALFGEPIFSRWGRSADEAENNARWQVAANARKLFARPA